MSPRLPGVNPLAGPVIAAATLLVAGGAPKTLRPATTVNALASVGVRVPAMVVRAFGAGEAVLGLAVVLIGGRVALTLTAASYAGFAAFVATALRRGGVVSSCGCVGRDDTPPTAAHLAVNLLFAALTAAAVAAPATGVIDLGRTAPGRTVMLVAVAWFVAWLGWLALAELPRLHVTRAVPDH